MRRSTVLGLMGWIALSALGMAALQSADEFWLSLLVQATVGMLSLSLVGSVVSQGASRARWFGFACFGWVYFAVTLVPGLTEKLPAHLATTRFLEYVHKEVDEYRNPHQARIEELEQVKTLLVRQIQLMDYMTGKDANDPELVKLRRKQGDLENELIVLKSPSNNWRTVLKAATQREPFLKLGHCLFTLLAGSLGSLAATFLRRPQ